MPSTTTRGGHACTRPFLCLTSRCFSSRGLLAFHAMIHGQFSVTRLPCSIVLVRCSTFLAASGLNIEVSCYCPAFVVNHRNGFWSPRAWGKCFGSWTSTSSFTSESEWRHHAGRAGKRVCWCDSMTSDQTSVRLQSVSKPHRHEEEAPNRQQTLRMYGARIRERRAEAIPALTLSQARHEHRLALQGCLPRTYWRCRT